MRLAVAIVLACVALNAMAQPALPTPCHDLSGAAYSSCTALATDRSMFNQTVNEGGYMRYHWVLQDWSVINVPDSERPEMTVEVSPCYGDVHLLVQGPSLQSDPFPTVENTLWEATSQYSPNAITFSLTAAQYFITVFGNMSSSYSIAVQVNDAAFPTPGGNATVAALAAQTSELLLEDDPISMDVTFITAETMHGDEDLYQYRVYFVPVIPGMPCGDENVTSTADCILTTHCGAEAAPGRQHTEWMTFPGLGGANVTIPVEGLVQNQEYTFTVAVRAPNGNVQMYTGTRGKPTYERVGQAQSDKTIIIVACSAVAVFVVLVACIFYAKHRLNRAFQERRLARQYKSIAPSADAAAKEAKATENPARDMKPAPAR